MSTPSSLPLREAVLMVAVSVWACGGGHDSSPRTPPQDAPVTIASGTERLAWTQAGEAGSGVAHYMFVAYVDGARALLPDATCRPLDSLAFDCSSPLPPMSPGRRSLELATMDVRTGAESARSPALAADVLVAIGAAQSDTASAPSTAVSSSVAVDAGQSNDSATAVRAPGWHDVTGVAAAGDRTFVAEPARVWIVDGARAAIAYDVSLEGEPSRIRVGGIQLDPRFDATRLVYMALLEKDPSGHELLQIRRAREAGGVLGEDAAIVSGLQIPDGTMPAWGIGDDGLVYIAIPGGPDAVASPSASAGTILRFAVTGESMGRSPVSPVLLAGVAQPLALQVSGGRGVLLGLTPGGVGGVAFDASGANASPERLVPAGTARVRATALWSAGPSFAPSRIFATAADGSVLVCGQVDRTASGARLVVTGKVRMPERASIVALSGASDHEAVVAVRDERRPDGAVTIRREQCGKPTPNAELTRN